MAWKSKKNQAKIAKERIFRLFELAEKHYKKKPSLAKRYVSLARKIAQRTNVCFPPELKRKFCKQCSAYLVPGFNCRIRTRKGKLVCTCLECNSSKRVPYLREKKSSKAS